MGSLREPRLQKRKEEAVETAIEILGGGDRIGGSHYLLDYQGFRIAIDYGAMQNTRPMKSPPFASEVDFAVLTHGHLDHCGFGALFAKLNPQAVHFMTKVTQRVSRLQHFDSLNIAISDLQYDMARKLGRAPEITDDQLQFTPDDVHNYMRQIRVVRNADWFSPKSGVRMRLRSAGHMPGAACVDFILPDGLRVTFTGDFSTTDMPLIRGAKPPTDFQPDVVVTESTYGNRSLPNRKKEERRLMECVGRVFEREGKILVTHFALTAANIAQPISRGIPADEYGPAIPGYPIYIDGMIRKAVDIYRFTSGWCDNDIPFELNDNLMRVGDESNPFYGIGFSDSDYRRALVEYAGPVVILSSSGMLEGGPSVGYLEAFVENHLNAVLIPGYQSEGTRGRLITQLARGENFEVVHRGVNRVTGKCWESRKSYRVFCDVATFQLSGHSDGDASAEYLVAMRPKKVITVHGDAEAHFGLRQRIHKLDSSIEVISGVNGARISL